MATEPVTPEGRGVWEPTSWRQYPVKQQPIYKDTAKLEKVLQKVRKLPPLVAKTENEDLKKAI